jgi:hypothetical protein
MKALTDEAEKLKSRGTWDISSVREWYQVAKEATSANKKVHVGRIFPIVVEKNAELPTGHPDRKFKGRIVFGGDQVTDEHNATAIFQELATSPASLEASNILDAYSLLPGNTGEQNDGTQAFTQAELGNVHSSVVTWARLPKELQPKSFEKYRDPVVIIKKALYGHPEAQGHWEQRRRSGFWPFSSSPSASSSSCRSATRPSSTARCRSTSMTT